MRIGLKALVVAALVVAAVCTAPPAAALVLGNAIFESAPAKPLEINRDAGAAFLRQTGGIAFANMAEGRDGIEVSALRFDPTAPDGRRLVIKQSPAPITQPLADISRFKDTVCEARSDLARYLQPDPLIQARQSRNSCNPTVCN